MKIRAHFPALPVKNEEYRDGSSCFFWEDYEEEGKDKNCVVIDGGEDRLLANTLEDIRKQGIRHVTAVCTHGHPDHTRGPEGLLKTSGIFVDKLITPPAEELKVLDYDDYKRLSNLIALAKSMDKPVIYPEAGKWTEYKVGGIRMLIWRRKGTTSDPKNYRVNNTSMQVYFPDLLTLITGDTIIIDKVIKVLPGKVVLFDGPHHCNACPTEPSQELKKQGAEICISDDMEPGGTIGKTGFTATGAERILEAGIKVLCITSPIDVVYAAGKMRVTQGSKTWEFPIPYKGEAKEGWIHGSKGWWYQRKDGTWPTGWAYLPWSQGKNWFFFDKNGWMQTGWVKDNGWWYYLDPATGAMLTGWLQYHGKWCYLEPVAGKNQGHAYMSQTAVIDGKTYIFDKDCYAREIVAADPSEDDGKNRLNVIDIASYQSGLDLTKVKVDGVIIKATQGTTYVNPCCNRHYAQAKQAGILRGLYHYASGVGAAAEADAFVRNIQSYVGDALLALDWEGAQNSAFGKNDVAYCKEFLDRVYAITGVRPLIYMSKSVCRAHDWSSVAKDYGLWVAQYASMDPTGFQSKPWTDSKGYGAWPYPAIYQYSSRGRLDGYSGNLDLDLAYMTREAWGKYAAAKR